MIFPSLLNAGLSLLLLLPMSSASALDKRQVTDLCLTTITDVVEVTSTIYISLPDTTSEVQTIQINSTIIETQTAQATELSSVEQDLTSTLFDYITVYITTTETLSNFAAITSTSIDLETVCMFNFSPSPYLSMNQT